MIGIYKITSPSNKIYIGQSVNLETRFKKYKNLNCKRQIPLYNSFMKYGYKNHVFEIIEECSIEQLNEREVYWGLYYDVLGKEGLNCRLGGANGLCSEKTKQKIGQGNKNKIMSKETRNNISKSLKNRPNTWVTKEIGNKISQGLKKHYENSENREKLSKGLKEYYKTHPAPIHPKLLTENQVMEIRNKHTQGQRICDLSREYNTSWGTIKNVVEKLGGYK